MTKRKAEKYLCEWERPDSPTRDLSEREARSYYKANSARGDCRFMLHIQQPFELMAAWAAQLSAMEQRGRETPDDKRVIAELRSAWAASSAGRPYAHLIPAIKAPSAKVRTTRPTSCPNCGVTLAA